MAQPRRIGHGQAPYLSAEDRAAQIAAAGEADGVPAAAELLTRALEALERAGQRVEVTTVIAPDMGTLAAAGRIGPTEQEVTVTQVPPGHSPHPPVPGRTGGPYSPEEAAAVARPDDPGEQLLAALLSALAEAEPQMVIEDLAPRRMGPLAVVSTPDGAWLTVATA